jgi:FlaA1/EpsC-like NDP-sugar epimerase
MAFITKLFVSIWHHSSIRLSLKVLIDIFLAASAWVTTVFLLNMDHSFAFNHCVIQWSMISLFANFIFQLPRQHYRLIGRLDFFLLLSASLALILLSLCFTYLGGWRDITPKAGTLVFAGAITGLYWTFFRLGLAEIYELRGTIERVGNDRPPRTERVIIAGAGRAGLLILEELSRHPELGQKVIGFVDGALDKQAILVHGMPVLGTFEDLPRLLVKHHINMVILAIPSASGTVIRRLTEVVSEAGVRVKTVPGLFNLLGNQPWAPEIKDVAIEDLLRREPVQLDQSALSQVIEDSVVLITGGGGSIGSELARQIAVFHPARIVLLGRGENSLWEVEQGLRGLFPNQTLSLELCDIRNPMRLRQAFERWMPEIVLHAAAHKHVPYLELNPSEAVQNNVLGTLNVVRETQAAGAHTLVNISTDKAVNPVNVLGATKFLAECVLLDAALTAQPRQRFVSVRFGNVLGSRGSVIPIFRAQIKKGGPLTVTHPDMTRYFMTIPEASQLVLQAGILGSNGRILVLDMGEPVRISDLAKDMARLSGLVVGQDIQILYTGIRPGEKLYEETFLAQEGQSCVHPKIFEGMRTPLDPVVFHEEIAALTGVLALPEGERQQEILRWLKRMVPTYLPSPNGLGRYEKDSLDRRVPGETRRAGSTPS